MTNPTHPDQKIDSVGAGSETASFTRRFFAATAEYAAFCAGAVVLVLFCMASYALVHRSGTEHTELRNWLLPLSLVVNVLAALSDRLYCFPAQTPHPSRSRVDQAELAQRVAGYVAALSWF